MLWKDYESVIGMGLGLHWDVIFIEIGIGIDCLGIACIGIDCIGIDSIGIDWIWH